MSALTPPGCLPVGAAPLQLPPQVPTQWLEMRHIESLPLTRSSWGGGLETPAGPVPRPTDA
eukprot:11018018-Alexandrium_andersonii.AAC.1